MTIDLKRCSIDDLHQIMLNARRRSDPEAKDRYLAAALEVLDRFRRECDDPLVGTCRGVFALKDRCYFETYGTRYKSNRSRIAMRNRGEIEFITDLVLRKGDTSGFDLLHSAGLTTCTIEYCCVAANPDRFPQNAVAAARARLAEHGVSLPE